MRKGSSHSESASTFAIAASDPATIQVQQDQQIGVVALTYASHCDPVKRSSHALFREARRQAHIVLGKSRDEQQQMRKAPFVCRVTRAVTLLNAD